MRWLSASSLLPTTGECMHMFILRMTLHIKLVFANLYTWTPTQYLRQGPPITENNLQGTESIEGIE
jgi:hypothetical protein